MGMKTAYFFENRLFFDKIWAREQRFFREKSDKNGTLCINKYRIYFDLCFPLIKVPIFYEGLRNLMKSPCFAFSLT